MDRKLNILLVVGKSQNLRAFDILESLTERHQIRAATFLNSLRKPIFQSQLLLQTFLEDQHLPGYMLGLEDELARADLVIAVGFHDQSTYQALRYCHQNNRHMVLFSSDPTDLKWAMEQDPKSLEDLIKFASGFIVYGKEAGESLEFIGVEKSRILTLSPTIATTRFDYQKKLRDRFRGYLNISQENYLIVCSDPLSHDSGARNLLFALRYILDQTPDFSEKMRLLFTGSGEIKEQLKYLAVDLQLGKNIMFISQDLTSIQRDLYSSADLSLSWINQSSLESAHAAFWILEAMACGSRPLVSCYHPLADDLSPAFTVQQNDYVTLASEILKGFYGRHESSYSRQSVVEFCRINFDVGEKSATLEKFIEELSANSSKVSIRCLNQEFQVLIQQLKTLSSQAPIEEIIDRIDKGLEIWHWHPEYRAQLQLFKGDLLLQIGDLDGAMSSFELCTADECVHREAYIGLARVAYLTYSSEEALSFYRKALAIKPNDSEAMSGLGQVYRKSGMPDDAVYWLGRSLSVDIDNKTTLMALTQACLECIDQQRAIDILEQLKAIIGERTPVIMALGQLYYKIGESEKGRALVDQALLASDQFTYKLLKVSNAS